MSGAGGDWTLVQTGTSCAFYTLIPAFGFRVQTRPGPPICTLSSKSHPQREAVMSYPRFSCATLPGRFGATAPEWHLVSAPGAEIKPEIYCTSIRQRERSCFRQIIFGNHWLKRAVANSLRAYTTPHPAVKSSQPRCAYAFWIAKVVKNIPFLLGNRKKVCYFAII